MNDLQYFEQTTQDDVRHESLNKMCVTEKLL